MPADVSALDALNPVVDAGDAGAGCGALAACCDTLAPGAKALCEEVASQGSTANCSTELSQLEATGSCSGVSVLASEIQLPPSRIVSDGATLFWTNVEGPGVFAMPTGGGAITTVLSESAQLVGVDDANLYVIEGGFLRIPKNGSPATLISEEGAAIRAVTVLGEQALWVEVSASSPEGASAYTFLKMAPLRGGPVTLVMQLTNPTSALMPPRSFPRLLGVTASSVFLAGFTGSIISAPLTASQPAMLTP